MLGAIVSVGLFGFVTWKAAPVLQADAILIGGCLLPTAAMTLLAANLAVLRSHRHGTDELYDGLATTRAGRTAGHLLSVAWPAGFALALTAVETIYLFFLGSVGRPSPFELLTGPAAVALFGVVGVAIGTWWQSVLIGPIALVAIGGAWLWVISHRNDGTLDLHAWLTPWVPALVNPEILIRPAATHVVYLLGLCALVGVVALARYDGWRRTGVGAVLALALVVVTAAVESKPPTPAQTAHLVALVEQPTRFQTCRTIEDVLYCAYPGYSGWIPRWNRVVAATLGPVPAGNRPQLEVRQTMWNDYWSDVPLSVQQRLESPTVRGVPRPPPDALTPGTAWGRAQSAGGYEFGLALSVAARAVGLPEASAFSGSQSYCNAVGESRALIALWLAANSSPEAAAALRRTAAREPYGTLEPGDPGVGSQTLYDVGGYAYQAEGNSSVDWGKAEVSYALQLLERPAAQVRDMVASHWDELAAPGTTTAQAVRVLGLRALPTWAQVLTRTGKYTPSEVRIRAKNAQNSLRKLQCR
ncbi:MAG TPA: hypothetical protein VEM41_11065 [Actinomycetota bacterium]|nr:hypothetical protein [Actinomycetota bacterium]